MAFPLRKRILIWLGIFAFFGVLILLVAQKSSRVPIAGAVIDDPYSEFAQRGRDFQFVSEPVVPGWITILIVIGGVFLFGWVIERGQRKNLSLDRDLVPTSGGRWRAREVSAEPPSPPRS
jgi:hypothetical protein